MEREAHTFLKNQQMVDFAARAQKLDYETHPANLRMHLLHSVGGHSFQNTLELFRQ